MSTLLFDALSDPDPYLACICGFSEHPHYHDCDSCHHASTCETGVGKKRLKELKAAIAEGEAMLASFRPKLDPARLP